MKLKHRGKICFRRENLFLGKKALSKSFDLITNKEEKLDFIEEYIENSTLRSTTYTEKHKSKNKF
jgi:hypothetical protein